MKPNDSHQDTDAESLSSVRPLRLPSRPTHGLRRGRCSAPGLLDGFALRHLQGQGPARKKEKPEREKKKELPEEIRAKTEAIQFGGQEYTVIRGKGKRLKQTVVGHEVHVPEDYDSEVEAKFPAGWHERLAKAFDGYLAAYDPDELNKGDHLFDLYKAWRDECKVGFNRVDLEKLIGWLGERKGKR